MDEIEVTRAIAKLRETIKELENPPLQEVIDTMIDLIEAAHERIAEVTGDEPDE